MHRALALDLGLGEFDPLTRDLAADFRGRVPQPLQEPAPLHGAQRAIPSSGSNGWHFNWSRACSPATAPGAGRGRYWTGSMPNSVPSLTPAGRLRSAHFFAGWTVVSFGPVHPVRRRGDGRMCCPPGAISLQLTCGPCRHLRRGGSGNWRRNAWSKAIGRRPANGRARSRCRPGAPPICAPAVMTSRRRSP